MKKKYLLFFAIAFPVILLDQWTKIWIMTNLSLFQSFPVLENFLDITYIRNRGGAFGIFSGTQMPYFQYVFWVMTVLIIGVIGFLYVQLEDHQKGPAISLSLIIGGAIGNLLDRFRFGAVIDFIDAHWYGLHWPAFNVADSAITVGAVILGVCIVLKKW